MISIIIPAYNVEEYLFECLESIKSQTFEDFETIIVDDGSNDGTIMVAESFSMNDSRFKVIRQDNQYAGIARNHGMSIADGDYLLFFDADDVMEPSMLERMISRATDSNADIVVCSSCDFQANAASSKKSARAPKYVEFNKVYSGNELGDDVFRCTVGWPWDKLFKRDFIRQHDLEFQGLPATNDAYFVFTAMALAERIAFIDVVLVNHRKRVGSIETARMGNPDNTLQAYNAIRNRLASEGCLDAFERAVSNWGIAHLRWDFRTLPDNAGQKTFEAYRTLLRSVADKGCDYLLEEPDRYVQKAFAVAESTSLGYSLANEAIEAYKWRSAAESKEARIKRLLKRVEELEVRYSDLEKENEIARREAQRLRSSVSYKVGRIVTAIPRKIRKKAQKK